MKKKKAEKEKSKIDWGKKKEMEKEVKILKEIKGTTEKGKGKIRRKIDRAKEKERQRDEKNCVKERREATKKGAE